MSFISSALKILYFILTKLGWDDISGNIAKFNTFTVFMQEDDSNHLVGLHMRLCLEELFYENRVNLHLSGHYHR